MPQRHTFDHAASIQMFRDGASLAKVSRQFKVTRQALTRMLQREAPDLYEARKSSRHVAAQKKIARAPEPMPLFSTKDADKPRPLKAVPKSAAKPKPTPTNPNTPVPAKKGPATMRNQIEMIGPDEARIILESNTLNRPLGETTVRRLAQDMIAGSWKQNGATIVFAKSGRLLDGQHRLHAVVRANMTLPFNVVYDVDEAAFDTIDNGKARSAGDIMALRGYRYGGLMSSAGRLIHNYASGSVLTSTLSRVPLTEFVDANPHIADIVNKVGASKTRFSKGPLAAVLFLGTLKEGMDAKVDPFLEALETGAGLAKSDPRLTLREWEGMERSRARNNLRSAPAFGAVARAWNAYATDKTLTTIRGISNPTLSSLPIVGFSSDKVTLPRKGLRLPSVDMVKGESARVLKRDDKGLFQPVDATVASPELVKA